MYRSDLDVSALSALRNRTVSFVCLQISAAELLRRLPRRLQCRLPRRLPRRLTNCVLALLDSCRSSGFHFYRACLPECAIARFVHSLIHVEAQTSKRSHSLRLVTEKARQESQAECFGCGPLDCYIRTRSCYGAFTTTHPNIGDFRNSMCSDGVTVVTRAELPCRRTYASLRVPWRAEK